MSLFARLWNASPALVVNGLKRRWQERELEPGWAKIKDGVLAGVEIHVPPTGSLWRQMLSGHYDEFLYGALPSRPNGKIVWDVGAHVGYHSLAFAALGAEVLAFEPNAANVELLEKNVQRNVKLAPHIRHLAMAVSDSDGTMEFKQSEDMRGPSTGSHLTAGLPPLSQADYQKFTATRVTTMRLDTLVESRGEKPPDIIKIDVEGAEEMVLRGGERLLKRRHPVLLMEVHHICLMFSIQKLLSDWGYETRLLDKEHASPSRCFIIAEWRGS
jgi:FkbM family methyltransferase